jgi:hypothetical protein
MKSAPFARAASADSRAARSARADFCQPSPRLARTAFGGRAKRARSPNRAPIPSPKKAAGRARRHRARRRRRGVRHARPSARPNRAKPHKRAARARTKQSRRRADLVGGSACANRRVIRNALIHHEKFFAIAFLRAPFWMCTRAQSVASKRAIDRCDGPKRHARRPVISANRDCQSGDRGRRAALTAHSKNGFEVVAGHAMMAFDGRFSGALRVE